ncbi:MAG: TIR domain-containing protein [Candidatus Latescibacteria bacterium]|nr:TIR domain-containing protein [Candidatus Latescibacterota bacterium]
MAYRNGNYTAFYVAEPYRSNLGPYTARDICFYGLLRAWKGRDSSFPFIDSHDKNYNVRDDSDWEKTLKPRIHERISNSKNIVLFLSSTTKNSTALREEIDYGINVMGLPIIIVYPDYTEKSDIILCEKKRIRQKIIDLWEKLPILRDSMHKVPTLHMPFKKDLITRALKNGNFAVNSKCEPSTYFYPC